MKELEGKFYNIVARHSSLVIYVCYADMKDMAELQQHVINKSTAQQFAFFALGDNWVIVARHSGKVLDSGLDLHFLDSYKILGQIFRGTITSGMSGRVYFTVPQISNSNSNL